MLDLINVRKTFNKGTINQRVALDGINLHLDDGDFVTVIGGNGARTSPRCPTTSAQSISAACSRTP